MSAPLRGVRVLDLTHFVAGPWCTMLLTELGAEVVKVEPPGGEIGRGMGGVYDAGESAIFLGFNRGKRSIALDLKHPEGLAAALQLAEQADVVVQNFRPGTAERLGLGAADLRARHPQLIYCTVSAFGADGPYATRPANDPVIQALSGAMAATGQAGGIPVRMGVSLPDLAAGVLATIAILAALHRRADTGIGSTVDLNLLDAQMYAQTDLITGAERPDPADTATTIRSHGDTAIGESDAAVEQSMETEPTSIRGAYVCSDSLYLWFNNEDLDTVWWDANLAWPTGRTPSTDAATDGPIRANREHLAALLRTQPRDYWLDLLGTDGIDVIPVLGLSDVLPGSPPRTLEVDHPTIGVLRQIRTPVTSNPSWPPVKTAPPRLGEHTRDILQELGFPATEIDRMAALGVVREASPLPTSPLRRHHTEEHHVEEQS